MKMLFKQRLFSWFDSYDIYDEQGGVLFTVKGEFSIGHRLRIFDNSGNSVGYIQQKMLSLFPQYNMFKGDEQIGSIRKVFSVFGPRFNIDFCGWLVEGDWFEYDYSITDALGDTVAVISKEFFNWTDTYSIDVKDPKDALYALMLVLAIDADKSSRNN